MWEKGKSGNPAGRPIGGNTELDQLLKAIKRVESTKNKKFLDHFVERAYESDIIAIAVAKKLIPDRKELGVGGIKDAPAIKLMDIKALKNAISTSI